MAGFCGNLMMMMMIIILMIILMIMMMICCLGGHLAGGRGGQVERLRLHEDAHQEAQAIY